MRRGGGRGGRGRGGGGGRRDARPGGAASRDDRDRRDRRPGYRPRRTPSPDPRARRPRSQDDDRDVPRGGRVEYGGDRDQRRGGRPDYGDRDHDQPGGGRPDYGRDLDQPRGGRPDYGRDRDQPRGGRPDYGRDRDQPRDRPDYRGARFPDPGHGELGYDEPPNLAGHRDYERVPYSQERDRYDRTSRGDRGESRRYEGPPAYMLPDHPSDLGRPSLRSGKKESDYFGGPSDPSLNRDSEYIGGPGSRSIDKERELLGCDGVALRISETDLGRTSSLYQSRRSSPPRAALSPPRRTALSPPRRAALSPPRCAVLSPPPRFPSVLPTETGFLMERSTMKTSDGFGTGSTRLLHDEDEFKYRRHLRDPYTERSRETEGHYPGSRNVLVERDGGTDSLYSARNVPARPDRETDMLYTSGDMLGSDLIGDSSSSLLAKGRPYRMHSGPDYEPSIGYGSLGNGKGHAHRFLGRSWEAGSGHEDKALLDITRQAYSKHAPRAETIGYEYVTRGQIDDTSENLRGNVSQSPKRILGFASLTDLNDERINHHMRLPHRMAGHEDSFQAMRYETEHNDNASADYTPARGGNDRYSRSPGTEPIGIARRPTHQHEFAPFEEDPDLSDQEVSPMVSRKRYRSPAYRDHAMDMCQANDGFTGPEYYSDDMDASDLSPPRMSRSLEMGDDEDEYDARYNMPTSHNVFSRLALPHETNGEWTDMDQGNHHHSNTMSYERSNSKPMSQRLSGPMVRSQFGIPMHGRGRGGLTKSAKKRLRTAPHQFRGGHTSETNDFSRPNKFSKSPEDDARGSEVNHHEDSLEFEDLPVQKDPPEGSEEFNKQVHQAFLKYAKILNESPAMLKKFHDAPKGSLSCCVCGSVARKFPDLDALLSHTYATCKLGLKTKHLGFHKALCVLMGLNWHVAPDTSKAHHSIPAEEVNAMKGDLMLWPPVVVIHNSSIGIKAKDIEAKILSTGEIEGVLADIGIVNGKAKVSHGRSANQSVFLVKFQPTISGFQEAMRIHDHFSATNHGKEEFQQMRGDKCKKATPVDNLEALLYAHIALAEDLHYLDEKSKKICVIKSKIDIEATADATLNLEP